MFHLKFPRFHGFFAWDELGCLSRAVGFPVDVFKANLTDEVQAEENGLPYTEMLKMLDYKLLYKSTHQTSNLHTADWNSCVFRRCAQILNHKALSYEDIYNTRVAYQAYEASDMKGMVLDQRILMRTLKMCGKTISPMKLMHRIKHSENSFDERGRIQLYELIDLILWAHGYEQYIPVETYSHFEMEDKMFKLVDFDQLLSHHDEKLAQRLDTKYLQDEWNFGRETLTKRAKFRDPTVICGDSRVEMARIQKKNYRSLKSSVEDSKKMVYCCKNGFVRARPKTAPEISSPQGSATPMMQYRKMSSATHNAILHKMQRLLKYSDCKQPREKTFHIDLTDKPVLTEYKRAETPKIVTKDELVNTSKHWERLMFDIETEEGRHELDKLVEMDHYIPGYLDKKEEDDERRPESPARNVKTPSKKSASPNRRAPADGSVSALAYPVPRIPPAHGKKCDARFRGWYNIRSRKGQHYVLVSPYYQKSPKGCLFNKLARDSSTEVKRVHGNFVHRHTGSSQLSQRPVTAPAVMTMAENQAVLKRNASRFQGSSSGYASMCETEEEECESDQDKAEDDSDVEEPEEYNVNAEVVENSPSVCTQDVDQLSESLESIETAVSDKLKLLASCQEPQSLNDGRPRAKSAFTRNVEADKADNDMAADGEGLYGRSKSAAGDYLSKMVAAEAVPVPFMDHSKPRVVSVGSIGRISLLENISEARYWEDISVTKQQEKIQEENDVDEVDVDREEKEEPTETKVEPPPKTTKQVKQIADNDEEEEEDIAELIKQEDHKRRQKIAMRSYSYMSAALTTLKQQRPRGKTSRGSSVRSASSLKGDNCTHEGHCQDKVQSLAKDQPTRNDKLNINKLNINKLNVNNLDIVEHPSSANCPRRSKSENRTVAQHTPAATDKQGNDTSKKTVTLKDISVNKVRKTSQKNKYGGFLNRMGEDIPPYIKRKMLVA